MPVVNDLSRYLFCNGVGDAQDRTLLTDRVPFRFVSRSDTRQHTVIEGDTLWGLANLYFSQIDRASGLWWVIADFNGIADPTLKLQPGVVLRIPSIRFVVEEVFAEARRADFQG